MSRSNFASQLATLELKHVDRAVALLWYYRQTQAFEERTASELADDLSDEGFPKPQASRLKAALASSRFTVRGRRKKSFKIDVRRLPELENDYGKLLERKRVEVGDAILPASWVEGTRPYLEGLVHQINGAYEYGFFDACAVLCRRLMESLTIEVYVHQGRQHEIRSSDGRLIGLEKLIRHVRQDKKLTLGRNTPATMDDIKDIGDAAAHDRYYITSKQDVDDVKRKYRRMIQTLLTAAGIRKKFPRGFRGQSLMAVK